MPQASRKLLVGLTLLLALCALLGALFGQALAGLAVGAVLALAHQVRLLVAFDRALSTSSFEDVRYGGSFWTDVYSRLRKLSTRGSKHKRRYRRLLREVRSSTNAMPDGAIILDDRNEIVLCNTAAQDLVGVKPRVDRGQRVDNILRDPTFMDYLRAGAFEEPIEVPSPLYDGHWLHLQIVPYGERQRLLVIRDITERVRLNKMRRDFVANASHELRSPLTVINGYLDTFSRDPDAPADWQRPLAQMQDQGARMRQIIEELIELSRLETAGSAPDDTPIDVARILERARNRYAEEGSSPEIILFCDPNLQLRGSETDIESVVTNLLSNAVRHTSEDGRIVIRWELAKSGAMLRFSDDGEGIPADYIPRLTERFFRVDRGRARAEGGIGLGLAIVKYALGRHEAELEIESTVGEGSIFTCRFPDNRVISSKEFVAAASP